jgi:cysteine desulfurase family protein (TIGR01976 family)
VSSFALQARARFPSLSRTDSLGRPVVFADAPGGTQLPEPVIEAMRAHQRRGVANTGGAFETSLETDQIVLGARVAAADFLGGEPDEIVFGPNATTMLFALSRAVARLLRPGDEVVVSDLDHDANITPWEVAARESGASLRRLPVATDDCDLDVDALRQTIDTTTRIVAFTLASNAVGTITSAAELVRTAREAGAITVVDAVHLAPHAPIDVNQLQADVVFCSPYKFFGPHVGIMWARRELLAEWSPYRLNAQSDEVPSRWETGTSNHEALAGVIACADYIASMAPTPQSSRRTAILDAMAEIKSHEEALSRTFLEGVHGISEIRPYGIRNPDDSSRRTPTFALLVGGQSARTTAELLAESGIFAWDGDFYAPRLMRLLGHGDDGGLLRVGFCHYHTEEEVDRVVGSIRLLADSAMPSAARPG